MECASTFKTVITAEEGQPDSLLSSVMAHMAKARIFAEHQFTWEDPETEFCVGAVRPCNFTGHGREATADGDSKPLLTTAIIQDAILQRR